MDHMELSLSRDKQNGDIVINAYSVDGVDGVLASEYLDLGNYQSTGALKESYDALCQKHNDMTYNREFVTRDGFGPHRTMSLGIDFTSIDIVSDADFDEDHRAGESLADITGFWCVSYRPYIDSNYTLDVPNTNLGKVSTIRESLTYITPGNKLSLLEARYSNMVTLFFQSLPTLSKSHTFTVTMTADDGRVFEDSIQMTFE